MTQDGRGRWLMEVFGLGAVVVSLVFVGLEVRQNTVAVRSATQQAIADQANELNIAMATDAQLSELTARMMRGATDAELTPGESWQLSMAVTAGLRRVENIYLQVQNGVLDEDAFNRIGFSLLHPPVLARPLGPRSRVVRP